MAKENYKHHANRRVNRCYKRSPDTFASLGDFGKQVGLGELGKHLVSAIGTGCAPNSAAPFETTATNKVAFYIIEGAVFGGLGLFLYHVLDEKDIAVRVYLDGTITMLSQIVSDRIHIN